jgi:chromosome segregation ATPase
MPGMADASNNTNNADIEGNDEVDNNYSRRYDKHVERLDNFTMEYRELKVEYRDLEEPIRELAKQIKSFAGAAHDLQELVVEHKGLVDERNALLQLMVSTSKTIENTSTIMAKESAENRKPQLNKIKGMSTLPQLLEMIASYC